MIYDAHKLQTDECEDQPENGNCDNRFHERKSGVLPATASRAHSKVPEGVGVGVGVWLGVGVGLGFDFAVGDGDGDGDVQFVGHGVGVMFMGVGTTGRLVGCGKVFDRVPCTS